MKIGISGASGQLGTATIMQLKARAPHVHVVGISRTPDKLSALGERDTRGRERGRRAHRPHVITGHEVGWSVPSLAGLLRD